MDKWLAYSSRGWLAYSSRDRTREKQQEKQRTARENKKIKSAMEKKAKMVCIIVGFFGALSVALGLAAEVTRVKANQIYEASSQCIFPSSPALGLALAAVVSLMIAHTLINVSTGCLCCGSEPFNSNYRLTAALACSSMSWFTFSAAVLLLFSGAALNYKQGEESTYYGNNICTVVKGGVFAGASILSLVTVVLGILSYIKVESAKNIVDRWASGQPGISMGQLPHQPGTAMGQAQVILFVQEDTYRRQQIA